MAKQTWVNVGGTWRKIKSAWIKMDGVWRKDVMPKGVVSGSYREFMEYISYDFLYTRNNYIYRIDRDLNTIYSLSLDSSTYSYSQPRYIKDKYILVLRTIDSTASSSTLLFIDVDSREVVKSVRVGASGANNASYAVAGNWIIGGSNRGNEDGRRFSYNLQEDEFHLNDGVPLTDSNMSGVDGDLEGHMYLSSSQRIRKIDYNDVPIWYRDPRPNTSYYIRDNIYILNDTTGVIYSENGGWRTLHRIILSTGAEMSTNMDGITIYNYYPNYDNQLYIYTSDGLQKRRSNMGVIWTRSEWNYQGRIFAVLPDDTVFMYQPGEVTKLDGNGDVIFKRFSSFYSNGINSFTSVEGLPSQNI